jgi:hypothetical protein
MKLHLAISASDINLELNKFLASSARNAWIKGKSISVFVRKGNHILDDGTNFTGTPDIANVSVSQKQWNKQIFKTFLLFVESLGYPVFVENVHNPILEDALVRYGYERDHKSHDVCFYKLGTKEAPWEHKGRL